MPDEELLDRIADTASAREHPVVIGISGFCGSGKSTLARTLVHDVDGAVRMRGDDFLDPARSHRRSTDWDGVDRGRLVSTVLSPFRDRRPSTFQRYDWSSSRLGPEEPLVQAEVLIIDLIGLFHPDTLPVLDLTIWCDVDLDIATRRGLARDRDLGRAHDDLWRDVWVPNEEDFAYRFAPREAADVLYSG